MSAGPGRRQVLAGGIAVLAATRMARAGAKTVTVTVEDFAFDPAEITVAAGDTIEWVNKDVVAHTATVEGGWEVMLDPGASGTHVAEAGDTVDYYCRFHPNMTGKITVAG